jgi:hypothetical protein
MTLLGIFSLLDAAVAVVFATRLSYSIPQKCSPMAHSLACQDLGFGPLTMHVQGYGESHRDLSKEPARHQHEKNGEDTVISRDSRRFKSQRAIKNSSYLPIP